MFPNKTKWLRRPIGWKDLGLVAKSTVQKDGKDYTQTTIHSMCKRRVRVGKENNELFNYCPNCLIKATYE